MDLHKSVGLIVFVLVVLRLVLRLLHKPAPLPGGMPAWEVQLAHVTQWLLYAAIVLLPVTGILGASYSRSGLKFFGTPLPAWLAKDRDTAELFFNIHSSLVWVLVALLALHVLGALKHLLLDHDQVFRRMWPRRHS